MVRGLLSGWRFRTHGKCGPHGAAGNAAMASSSVRWRASNWVYSAVFSPNDVRCEGSDDTTTRLWDSATGKELATLISAENGDWFVTDPEGRFDTNDLDGGAPLNWVVDNAPMRPLPLEIFMRDYYTPRLLSRIINGEKLPPVRSIAEITNRVQPDVAVTSISASNAHPDRVDVVVHAANRAEEKTDAKGIVLQDALGKVETQACVAGL